MLCQDGNIGVVSVFKHGFEDENDFTLELSKVFLEDIQTEASRKSMISGVVICENSTEIVDKSLVKEHSDICMDFSLDELDDKIENFVTNREII